MWEQILLALRKLTSRSAFNYILVAMFATFLWFVAPSAPVSAADASWQNQSIVYQSKNYVGPLTASKSSGIDIPDGSTYYSYVEDSDGNTKKAYVIYFTSGQDPGQATTAKFKTYTLQGSKFSSPSTETSITIDENTDPAGGTTSCVVEGIGWIICPVTNFLASGMDWVFSILKTFIEVQPINTADSNNALYSTWNITRSFSNIAFIIAFLVIIYSQITGMGISNYGVKKLFPRLLVAAILVNLSYFICAVAVDISNILGYAIQDMFIQIRNSLFDNGTQWSSDILSWESVTGAVLAGSAASLGAVLGATSILAASGGSLAGAIFLLLPVLVGLFLTVLVVLLILAARQALIVILIIIAPLAFVANLLPNTEKWFEKWRSLFMTMMIFFPAFSLVYGGSQLAGAIIIQNANSILIVILGMMVQVAPLVITPFLIKFSGTVLGKFAGIVNNPRRGMIDRTRKWATGRAEERKYQALGSNLKTQNIARRAARNMEYRSQQTARRTELNKQLFDNYATNRRQTSRRDQRTEVRSALAKMQAHEYEERFGLAMDEMRAGRTDTLDRLNAMGPNTGFARLGNRVENRFRPNAQARFVQEALRQSVELDQEARVTTSARASAQNVQQQAFAERIRTDVHLQVEAGGIDRNGAQRAVANAVAAIARSSEESLKNIRVIISSINPTSDDILQLAGGNAISDAANQLRVEATTEARAAALDMIFGGSSTKQILTAIQDIDFSFPGLDAEARSNLLVTISNALQPNIQKPPILGAGAIEMMKQGLDFTGTPFAGSYGQAGLDAMVIDAINKQKLDTMKLKFAGRDNAVTILGAVQRNPGQISAQARARLVAELTTTLDPTREASEQLGDSRTVLEDILRTL